MLFTFITTVVDMAVTETAELEKLVKRLGAGDDSALEAIYEKTSAAVYGFAISLLGNRADAEDVMQDTFLSIINSAGKYSAMGKPMAWICTIVKNAARMKFRETKRNAVISDEELANISSVEGLSSEDKLVLNAALTTLSKEERQIVMLHAVAGFKHREIAQLLGLPLATTLSKHSRAIKKLQAVLEEQST